METDPPKPAESALLEEARQLGERARQSIDEAKKSESLRVEHLQELRNEIVRLQCALGGLEPAERAQPPGSREKSASQ